MNRKINAITSRNVFAINDKYTKAPKKTFFISLSIIVFILIIFGFNMLETNWVEFFSSFSLFFERIGDLIRWDWEDFLKPDTVGIVFFNTALYSIFMTMITAFAGTIIGVLIAIPVAILAAGNIVTNKFINNTAKSLIAIFRTIPAFVYALIFVGYFGQTILTVTIVLSIFTFSITSKILFERIEHINTKIFISQQATGANKMRSFRSAVVPQISNHITSATFYALETNIRYISVIGGVTNYGIGKLIDDSRGNDDWSRVGFLLFLIISVVILLELIIYVLRKYILLDKDFILDEKNQKKYSTLIKKISRMNNLNFYIRYVIQKDLFLNLEIAKQNKDFNSIKEIKEEMRIKKNNFLSDHKSKMKKDINDFEIFKSQNLNSKNWFIWDAENSMNVRRDKIYLTNFNFEVLKLKEEIKSNLDNTALQEHETYLKNLTIDEVIKKNPKRYIKRLCLYFILFALFCYSLTFIEFNIESAETIKNTNNNIIEMFKINWLSLFIAHGYAPQSVIYLLFQTLSIAIVGTFIGAIVAYVFGILSSENIVNYYVAKFFVLITSIIRSIPTYIYAILFIALVGMGPFTATLAIAAGTVGMLTKYNREVFDDINLKVLYQLESTGLNKFQRFKYGVMPQTTSSVISYIIYRFDINFKEVALLGVVSSGNMGYLLNSYFADQLFNEFGALLFGIILFTLLIEYISTTLRNKINLGINPKYIDKIILFIKHKNFAKYKANEILGLSKADFEYIQSEAYYAYINKVIYQEAKIISKDKKVSRSHGWYLSYIKNFNLSNNLDLDLQEAKKIYNKHNLEYKNLIKEFNEKRIDFIQKLKNSKAEQIKELDLNSKNILEDKSFKKEIKASKSFIRKSTKIKIESLEY
ncbi:phosphonate ABC transporter permease [Spiroplasma cantharicola]|uniref:Phosphonate ABC transporter permease n=2 Tax=Spiroplasma cantharicola TaxID=362837 RepID=A0A0M3SJ45_9MOLU|nr:phosphonate ABC transporter permease [Spiroplasma cantharicola]